jgi:hypothetical protein
MRSFLGLLTILSTFIASASTLQGWTTPVTYSEAAFACQGLTPDLSVAPAVNLAAGPNGGEYRVQSAAGQSPLSLQGKTLILHSDQGPVAFGTLQTAPTCTQDDSSDPADPSWNAIAFAADLHPILTFAPDASSCQTESVTGAGFVRTDTYTLSVIDVTGASKSVTWTEKNYFTSMSDCQLANF